MFTVVATFAIFLYITWERTLNDKYEEVKALSSFLDKQLDDTVLEIISAPNLTNDEKIQHLNVALQPSIDNVTASYENVGAGYYIKSLNTIVAFGPDFSPSGLIDISPESQARTVYKTAQDFEFHNYSQTREGFVVANIHPLIRNGEIIGHSWGNVLLDDVLTMFKDDFLTFLSILAAMLLIAFIGSHLITKQFKKSLALFKNHILHNDYAIVKSIISIAESLSLRVVAEGVETELQLAKLKSLHCDIIQGFYYYKPKPAEEIFALLNVTTEK